MVDSVVGRLFVAAPLPAETRYVLAGRVADLRIPGKVSPPENWHVTLRFLDTIDQLTYERFLFEVSVLREEFAFPVALDGFGAFPNPRKATVFWAGVGRGATELALLNEIIEEAAQAAGLSPEDRPFHPHVTLSRIRPPVDVRDLLDEDFVSSWRCDRVVLYRSHVGRGPARYEALDSVVLIG